MNDEFIGYWVQNYGISERRSGANLFLIVRDTIWPYRPVVRAQVLGIGL